jgi:hypothetical protein
VLFAKLPTVNGLDVPVPVLLLGLDVAVKPVTGLPPLKFAVKGTDAL